MLRHDQITRITAVRRIWDNLLHVSYLKSNNDWHNRGENFYQECDNISSVLLLYREPYIIPKDLIWVNSVPAVQNLLIQFYIVLDVIIYT